LFTGIIEEVGIVESVRAGRLTISATKVIEDAESGDSIAVNGACLTVAALGPNSFSVDVMPETLHRTNLGMLHPGDEVNLERALSLGGHLGGHLVQGHVDAVGRVQHLVPDGEAVIVRCAAPPEVMCYVVEKGFIAVDGVSLTIIDHDAASFRVSLVAYTRQHTVLGSKRPGDLVNLEADIVAKYVERFTMKRGSGITYEFLAEHGF
jgi:riboflavin synthase